VNKAGVRHSEISYDEGVYLAPETNIIVTYKDGYSRHGEVQRSTWKIGLTLNGWSDTIEENGEAQ